MDQTPYTNPRGQNCQFFYPKQLKIREKAVANMKSNKSQHNVSSPYNFKIEDSTSIQG